MDTIDFNDLASEAAFEQIWGLLWELGQVESLDGAQHDRILLAWRAADRCPMIRVFIVEHASEDWVYVTTEEER